MSDRLAKIVEMRRSGASYREIGIVFGITRERVRQILNGSGLQDLVGPRGTIKNARRETEFNISVDEIVAQREAGHSIAAIGKQFGIPVQTIKTILRDAGRGDLVLRVSTKIEKRCINCGAPFVVKRTRTSTKYCSVACGQTRDPRQRLSGESYTVAMLLMKAVGQTWDAIATTYNIASPAVIIRCRKFAKKHGIDISWAGKRGKTRGTAPQEIVDRLKEMAEAIGEH